MKNIKRILIECFIIAFVFGTFNFASGRVTTIPLKEAGWKKDFLPVGVALSKDDAKVLADIWSKVYKKKYGAIGGFRIVATYNKDTMELNTASVPIRGIQYDPQSFDFLAQGYSVSSVVESNNDLAKRVGDLENRIQDIENKCCP